MVLPGVKHSDLQGVCVSVYVFLSVCPVLASYPQHGEEGTGTTGPLLTFGPSGLWAVLSPLRPVVGPLQGSLPLDFLYGHPSTSLPQCFPAAPPPPSFASAPGSSWLTNLLFCLKRVSPLAHSNVDTHTLLPASPNWPAPLQSGDPILQVGVSSSPGGGSLSTLDSLAVLIPNQGKESLLSLLQDLRAAWHRNQAIAPSRHPPSTK
jgi:hypothetical protein